ncbi:[NiFe] hydrogenase metallocenter assembly protein HypF [Methylomonas albis]|uniref:Carbamoyltransferase HypF n=1 Tax=Methylomonas albis TaxID=1854563 RepID=A0ABR9D721_9GAMM|nr:carbamoyltransferase HypF [Methylomonas albis]MBD9358073.1 carbamoyltransferase HypF [Methylomonas albis]CAD6881434.1 [NiFe] hydrogenase metallocenter assembly protein HypF [Methylomonas albis]
MPGKAIRARGVVQGVGFRPAIWHLAREFGLTGSVWNDAEGVMIHVHGDAAALEGFAAAIPKQLPPLARLDALEISDLVEEAADSEFRILASQSGRAETAIAADAATCPDCLADIADPGNRRYRYPFTNCTHCGPRLSIVKRVPYDRCHTSMAAFAMCPACQREYDDPADRRFHAQANCCPVCGPKLWLEAASIHTLGEGMQLEPLGGSGRWSVQDGVPTQSVGTMSGMNEFIRQTADLIRQGYIVAIKGLGGFHLACDAGNAIAVDELRRRKRRYAKPFALMARDVDTIRRYAAINDLELIALQSTAAPIVLLPATGEQLAEAIAPGDDKLGFMLPYTPLHALLLAELHAPIVLTSGNVSDEPQCISNDEAREKLVGIADFLLLHDRAIVNRLDDSVARLMAGEIRLLRRARGYAPEALTLPKGFESSMPVLAMGAELKNSFCLLKNGQAIVSQHIGDLENAAVQQDYRHAIALYRQLHAFTPTCLAIDSHDGYLSNQYGRQLAAETGLQVVSVQHHHAHLAASLAEHGVELDAPPVLAAIFDGLGLGEHGELWGGEFLLGDYRHYTRLGHFQPIALPGGSQAMREPWRNAYAQLRHYFDWQTLQSKYADLEIMRLLAGKPLATLDTMIDKTLNSPLSSSCGRWFDAFAAALGLHPEQVHFEGQAAIAMEVLATPVFSYEQAYPATWSMDRSGDFLVLSWQGLWQAVLDDLACGTDKARIAARIHHTLAAATVGVLNRLSGQTGADSIVLSGGVFQNRLLLEAVSEQLRQQGKTLLSPQRYPMNDGGLALGQAMIAAARHH